MQDFVKTMNWRDDRDSHGHGELVSRDPSLPFGWAIAAYCWMLSWLPLWGGHLQLSYQLCRPLAKGNCSFASDAADFRLKLSFRNKGKMTWLFFALSHSATITNRLRRSRTHKLIILSLVIGPIHKFFSYWELRISGLQRKLYAHGFLFIDALCDKKTISGRLRFLIS